MWDAKRQAESAAAINVKPVVGGVEIAVRYVTRANERYHLRAKLYQAAVEMLGSKKCAVTATATANPHDRTLFRLS